MCHKFGYHEIRTPVFEHTELFLRGVGETTDIVQKEMYTFDDRGGRSLTLKAEGTAPVARAHIEHKLHGQTQPIKMYYITPVFRYERPQAGRYRQHEQCGVEVFGASSAQADAEVIILADTFYRELGLNKFELAINSVGCPECRVTHRATLQEALRPVLHELCQDCQGRFERNPMRILDCKNATCQLHTAHAPTTRDTLCLACEEHYGKVRELLTAASVQHRENPRLVRGLDYYTRTAFEFLSVGIGAQSAIGGGGRYDGLMESVGGQPTPGVGFGLGVERILLAMELEGVEIPEPPGVHVFAIGLGEVAAQYAFSLVQDLRRAGVPAETDLLERSLKAQLKYAAKISAGKVVIIGESEMEKQVAVVRDMAGGEQKEVPLPELIALLTNR
jgi:histidyl-tRNA synthetase